MINERLMKRFAAKQLPSGPGTVLWSFSPIDYNIGDRFQHRVYHSVDFLHEIPGIHRATLLTAERDLAARADVCLASSATIAKHLETVTGREVATWENVAETQLFASVSHDREDRMVFAGNITETKIDFTLLAGLLGKGHHIDLAGPLSIDGTAIGHAAREVMSHPNIRYHGLLSLEEMAALFAKCKVGLIPYLNNPYTAGVFPMKVYEYLSAGLSVVATDIPSLRGRSIHGLKVEETYHDYISVASDELSSFDSESAARRTALSLENSWGNRIDQATKLLEQLTRTTTGQRDDG